MSFKRLPYALTLVLLAAGCSEEPPPEQSIGTPGVRLSKVALYQGPEVVLAEDGAAVVSTVPVMARRDALLRVFYETTAEYDGLPVTTRLSLGGTTVETTQPLYENSLAGAFLSTVNFTLPAEQVVPGDYSVQMTQLGNAADDNAAARYPASGQEPLPTMVTGRTLRVVIIPFRYDFDGSMLLPDTSPEQLDRMTARLYALFPLADVEFTLHEVVPYANEMGLNDVNGLVTFLDTVVQLRSDEAPDDEVYYHGMILPAPAASADDGALLAGLAAMVDTPEDPTLRASVSLGVSGDGSARTFVHELGHLLGRRHSPCGGATGPDLDYPHAGAGIGVLGFDIVDQRLAQVEESYDIMGYCGPKFISDYTYTKVATQLEEVFTAAQAYRAGASGPTLFSRAWYTRVSIHPDGSLHPLSPVQRRAPADPLVVTLELADGSIVSATGSMSTFDHAGGGILHVPLQRQAIAALLSVARP